MTFKEIRNLFIAMLVGAGVVFLFFNYYATSDKAIEKVIEKSSKINKDYKVLQSHTKVVRDSYDTNEQILSKDIEFDKKRLKKFHNIKAETLEGEVEKARTIIKQQEVLINSLEIKIMFQNKHIEELNDIIDINTRLQEKSARLMKQNVITIKTLKKSDTILKIVAGVGIAVAFGGGVVGGLYIPT